MEKKMIEFLKGIFFIEDDVKRFILDVEFFFFYLSVRLYFLVV